MGFESKPDAEYFLDLQTQTGWGRTLAVFADWCQPCPGWKILDIGCGPGLLPALFQANKCWAVGVDVDEEMFHPRPLHPIIALADVHRLPFASGAFDQVTASNLLFLLPNPIPALSEMVRVLHPGGQAVFLNPSEHLTIQAAREFAESRGLSGLAWDTFLNWAARAEDNHRWDAAQTGILFAAAGLTLDETTLKIGPGFARFSRGRSII
jgi:SAM-dependent methyltransferase